MNQKTTTFAQSMVQFYLAGLAPEVAIRQLEAMVQRVAYYLHTVDEPNPDKACQQAEEAELYTRAFADMLNAQFGWTFNVSDMLNDVRL